jgi:hypothetical protein|tara:strand:- start:118 stop:480 length:363 start_codon:yes stop_codon:yes gene_type:complete
MPTATLTFTAPLNTSCQVGDIAYYVSTTTSGGFTVNSNTVQEIGRILEITNPTSTSPTIICDTTAPGSLNGSSKYIFFGKSNQANLSSILGYYASVTLLNDSTTEAEIHRVSMDMFESSK